MFGTSLPGGSDAAASVRDGFDAVASNPEEVATASDLDVDLEDAEPSLDDFAMIARTGLGELAMSGHRLDDPAFAAQLPGAAPRQHPRVHAEEAHRQDVQADELRDQDAPEHLLDDPEALHFPGDLVAECFRGALAATRYPDGLGVEH